MKFSIFNTLFVFCAVFLATSGVAFAATCQCGWTTCATNQRCIEEYYWDQEEQIWDYDYYCEDCPSGQVHSSSDCYQCVAQPCQGYTDCPSGIGGAGKKCKVITGEDGCPSSSGCTKYEICDTSNNAITYQASSGCHIEGSYHVCKPNTLPCSEFSIDGQHGNWECQRSQQTGNAEWDISLQKWYVGNCTCGFTDRNIDNMGVGDSIIKCQKASAEYVVWPGTVYEDDIGGGIYYVPTRRYCSKCYPGFLPTIVAASNTWQDNGISITTNYNDGSNNSWGAWKCDVGVTAPYYSDGCVINFSLSTGTAAINDPACKKSCPIGTKTTQNGAISVSACNQLDTDQRFQDDTGIFTITGYAQCSNNP